MTPSASRSLSEVLDRPVPLPPPAGYSALTVEPNTLAHGGKTGERTSAEGGTSGGASMGAAYAGSALPDVQAQIESLRRPRHRAVLAGMTALLAVFVVIGAGAGAFRIPPMQVLGILAESIGLSTPIEVQDRYELVLMGIRMPRVLLAVVAGMGLSLSGALMQGLFRNPLADPALIGVSSGASFGASVMIVLGSSMPGFLASVLGTFSIALSAFVMGLAVTVVVFRIATRGARTSVSTMLLAGIALNAICGAGTGALILFSNDSQLRDLTFWSLGSLGSATWSSLAVVAPFTLFTLLVSPRLARSLNAMLLGESEAAHLGIRTERVKRLVVVLAALTVGSLTALTGLIGFVGLVVPHLVRLTLGPDHRILLPASALLGAMLMVGADTLARILLQPAEIPIGILTALAGAPFFLWLLVRGYSRPGTL